MREVRDGVFEKPENESESNCAGCLYDVESESEVLSFDVFEFAISSSTSASISR